MSVVVEVADAIELERALQGPHGQLTATLITEAQDLDSFANLVPLLEQKAGRLLLNGYPTGVEVYDAMVHEGPYPATSDGRGTSVGILAIDRFLRPVCYQNYPDALLPDALNNAPPPGPAAPDRWRAQLRRGVTAKPRAARGGRGFKRSGILDALAIDWIEDQAKLSTSITGIRGFCGQLPARSGPTLSSITGISSPARPNWR